MTSSLGRIGLAYQMWPPQLVCCLGVVQLDVQVLIHALQRPPYAHLILEFDGNFGVDKRLEEATRIDLSVYTHFRTPNTFSSSAL